MKSLMNVLLVGILAIFFASCVDKPTGLENLNLESEALESVDYQLTIAPDKVSYEEIVLTAETELKTNSENNIAQKNSNSAHTHGDFHAFTSTIISFSGTQNDGGAHGSAEFQQMVTLPFPPFGGLAHIVMDTESVVVNGDRAIYGGLITQVLNNGGFPAGSGPFTLGRHFYFQVQDNGQGANAPKDQYRGILFSLSTPAPNGGANLPWSFGTMQNVKNSDDKIKVN